MKLSLQHRNAVIDTVGSAPDQGSGRATGYLEIRGAPRPASPQDPATGRILATFDFLKPAFRDPINGVIAARPLADATVTHPGTAVWFRIYNRDSEAICDGDVTGPGGNGDLIFDGIDFIPDATVRISELAFTVDE